jgi:hypothetical protein
MSRIAVNVVVDLPLPRHSDEGEEDGNDGMTTIPQESFHYSLLEVCWHWKYIDIFAPE